MRLHLGPALLVLAAVALSGCGTTPPRLSESWEATDVSDDMVLNIKRNIFCEAIAAIRAINDVKTSFGPAIPGNYGMQLQLTLTVSEAGSLTPNLNYTRTLRTGTASGVSIGRYFGLGASGDVSSTATRIDTTYSYWNVGIISAKGANKEVCDDWPVDRRGSSLLLQADLGIKRFLFDHVMAADYLHSSKPAGKKTPDKIDVYSYDLKFAIVTSAGLSPSFKLVKLSGGGAPILNLSRTRTHELLLTFGPTGPDGFQPSSISFGQHLNTQLDSTLSRINGL